ncbi:unnamed protein product [Brassica rapa subsp. narinosa]
MSINPCLEDKVVISSSRFCGQFLLECKSEKQCEQWYSSLSYSSVTYVSSPESNSIISSLTRGFSPSTDTCTLAVVFVSSWFSRVPNSWPTLQTMSSCQ